MSGYNGWKNYETWVTALWIDNDQGTYSHSRFLTQEAHDDAASDSRTGDVWTLEQTRRFTLADTLKDWVEEELLPDPDGIAGLASDLMRSAFEEIDWNEIAEHYLSEVEHEETPA